MSGMEKPFVKPWQRNWVVVSSYPCKRCLRLLGFTGVGSGVVVWGWGPVLPCTAGVRGLGPVNPATELWVGALTL